MAFVHLHVHSQFSLLDGTMSPGQLAAAVAERGMKAVALTDSANLFGAVAFYKACKGAGIKAILGAELNVQPEGIHYEDPRGVEGGYQLVALVENDAGYRSLCKLITRGIFDGIHYKPRVDLDLLRAHSDGLIFLTGGRKGLAGRPIERREPDVARRRFIQLAEFLDRDHLYLELQDLGLEHQEATNEFLRGLAAETGYETVVTNGVHYRDPHDAPVLETLNAIALGCSVSDTRRMQSPTDQAWLKPEAEMRALFPRDADAIERTSAIAERCHYHFDFGTYHFPATTPPDVDAEGNQPDTDRNWEYFYKAFPPPRDYGLPDPAEAIPPRPEGAGNLKGYFQWYCERGLDLRIEQLGLPEEQHAEYRERLEIEIGIINQMGFPAYMLIVAEFINWSKDNAIPVGPGRGSAAGSLVAYAMRITDIDPIRYGLLFERFLNPERVSMPDIDVDFCQDRREEAIEHVREKYGADLVSQIITYGTLKAKAAIRDVARVLDLMFHEADRIAKLVPDQLGITLKEALEQAEMLRALRDGDPKVRRVLTLAQRVEGMNRQTGVHAAGVVIADQPLVEYAPLYRDEPEGGPVVQYDMKSAESIGLIKFDFLGLKTLDQIRDAVALIEQNHGIQVDMSALPVDDERTYDLLQAGDALGVFQLESSGMRELLTRLKPNVIDDMVALVALYRPGPLQTGMTDDFVERKHGRKAVEYPHPMLEPILHSTYGTIIYQEQVMEIARVMAGYSLGGADLLRRAMGKKKKEEMDKQQVLFVDGAVKNGVPKEKAVEIFSMLAEFAKYGFNKSHSAAYGYISYQTAYLKAHYRPEYMAALMTIEAANTDKVLMYINDCRNAGIRVDGVCVNESQRHFDVPPPNQRNGVDSIRFGLAAVKNVGGAAIEALIEARAECGGRFPDAVTVFEKVDYRRVNKRVYENLIKAGAFDCFGVPRAALMEGLEQVTALGQRRQEDAAIGQTSLFAAMAPTSRPESYRFPEIAEWPLSAKLHAEKEVLGLYLTGHPMEAHQRDVARYASCPIAALDQHQPDAEVRILGLVANVNVKRTRNGDKMAFVDLEDVDGGVECVFFGDAWARSKRLLEASQSGSAGGGDDESAEERPGGQPILVTGQLQWRNDELKIRAKTAELLSDLRTRTTREVTLRLCSDELVGDRLAQLRALLERYSGSCPARLVVDVPGKYAAHMGLPGYPVDPGSGFEEGVTALFGRTDVVGLA